MSDWPDAWLACTDPEAQALEAQLRIEVGSAHVLKGVQVRLLARRIDSDDALFALTDGRVAEVHLTWNSTPEENPAWPSTVLYCSLAAWRETQKID